MGDLYCLDSCSKDITGKPKLNLAVLNIKISLVSLKQIIIEREEFIFHLRPFKRVVVAGIGSVVRV